MDKLSLVDLQKSLLESIKLGRDQIASSLLIAGVNPNFNIDDTTPLIEAAKKGKINLIEDLLKHGARVATEDSKGNSALSFAKDYFMKALLESALEAQRAEAKKNKS